MKDDELLPLPESESPSPSMVRPALRRGYRLLYPLLALLVIVALAPLASLAWKLLKTNRETLVTSQQEYQLLLASSIAGQLDSHVDGLQGRIGGIGSSFGTLIQTQGLAAVERDLSRRPVLGGLLDENLLALRLVTAAGRSYQARTADLDVPEEVEGLIGRAVAAGLEAGEGGGLVSPPCLIPGRGAAVVISAPVIAAGSVQGVLVGLVDLSRVWQRVLDRNPTGHTVYAIDRQGHLFAHTDGRLLAQRADLRDTEIVQRFLTGAGRSKETMLFNLPQAGEAPRSMLGSYESTSRGWGIFVQVEERLAYATIRKMVRDTVTWSLGAVIVATILGIAFAQQLSRPVHRLTEAARAFADLDFTARSPVKGRNEIAELAGTFNWMGERIEDHIRQVQELFDGTVSALAEAIDAKDPYTRGHSSRVKKYACVIADYMNLDKEEKDQVKYASLLHDVGKIGIDDRILKKPAGLTPEEWEIMKQHPDKGARIMREVKQLKSVIPGMRHHHERCDGSGYPDGLKGEDIPLVARIVAVADSFDAMTSDRPYSRAWTFERATARLNEIKGTAFDPEVVEAWNRAYAAGEFAEEERRLAEKMAAVEAGAVGTTPLAAATGEGVLRPSDRGYAPACAFDTGTPVAVGPAGGDDDGELEPSAAAAGTAGTEGRGDRTA